MNWYINLLRKIAFFVLNKLYDALYNLLDKNKDGFLDDKEIKNSLKEIQQFLGKYKGASND